MPFLFPADVLPHPPADVAPTPMDHVIQYFTFQSFQQQGMQSEQIGKSKDLRIAATANCCLALMH